MFSVFVEWKNQVGGHQSPMKAIPAKMQICLFSFFYLEDVAWLLLW